MPLPSLEHAALLVIDVQAGLFSAERPPFDAAGVIERINALTVKAREAAAPVFLIQHESPADGLAPGSPDWELHADLKTQASDILLGKAACDAFYRTSLEDQLRARKITTLVLTGYATDFCVDSTLRNALSKGFEVVVAGDAHTTHENPVLGPELVRRHHNWAWSECTAAKPVRVVPADEIQFGEA